MFSTKISEGNVLGQLLYFIQAMLAMHACFPFDPVTADLCCYSFCLCLVVHCDACCMGCEGSSPFIIESSRVETIGYTLAINQIRKHFGDFDVKFCPPGLHSINLN